MYVFIWETSENNGGLFVPKFQENSFSETTDNNNSQETNNYLLYILLILRRTTICTEGSPGDLERVSITEKEKNSGLIAGEWRC